MAIYIGLKKIDEDDVTAFYSFFECNGCEYGTLGIDKISGEVVLIKIVNPKKIGFAFPRARRAIQKAFDAGQCPDECCYTA